MNNLYRASTLKRKRRTNKELEQLDSQIVDALTIDHPQSVRHIFYLMTDPRLPEPVEKSDRGYRHVQDRCVKLRRSGKLPYSWIADMSRSGYLIDTYTGAGDFIRQMRGLYRSDLWRESKWRCEVWCESRSIASVILNDCHELAVSLYPCGGFSSLSFVHSAADKHNNSGTNKPLQILYIGDYDPAGVLIDVSLERELRAHLNNGIDLVFNRIAINQEQIQAYGLPEKPRKKSDKRSLEVKHTVEAESMPAHIMRTLLRDSVESLLPPGALEVAKIAEQSERNYLRLLADHIDARGGL